MLFISNFIINTNMFIIKAFKRLDFILRTTRKFKNVNTLIMLHFSLLRPNTEFRLLVWDQHSTGKLVDNVQYKFLKSVDFHFNSPIFRDMFLLVPNTIVLYIYILPCVVRYKLFLFIIF